MKTVPSLSTTRRIRLVADHLRAVGPYQHGQDYDVPADVAARLVPARGFVYVDDLTGTDPVDQDAHPHAPIDPLEIHP